MPIFLFKGDVLHLFTHCEIFEISKVAWKITLLFIEVSLNLVLLGSAKETGAGTGSWHSKHISKLAAVTTQDQRGFWVANVLLLCAADADHYSYITVYLVLACCSCPGMTLIQKQIYFCCDSAN